MPHVKVSVTADEKERKADETDIPEHLIYVIERLFQVDRPPFPLHVFPSSVRKYILAYAASISCPVDLLAVPLLSIAGAATGRSGRRLKVKPGWEVSSCLWTACLLESGGGKTPALQAVKCFYDDRQEVEYSKKRLGGYPILALTDTTIESLRSDLRGGPVLFCRDELAGWAHTMSQYKNNGADRYDWSSFWSHSPVHIGRKLERLYIKSPFVSVTGMLVPASAKELNYRGHADDGFVHRLLLSCPQGSWPVATVNGVNGPLAFKYRKQMSQLFGLPEKEDRYLTFEPKARDMVLKWANAELFRELRPITHPDYEAPGWLVSKYRKLYENCLRLCLVLHEIWRVCDHQPEDWEWNPRDFYGTEIEWQDTVVDRLTVERAISVVNYFMAHIETVQSFLGEEVDDVDRQYARLKSQRSVSIRDVIRGTTYKSSDRVKGLFSEWDRRGYGSITHPRKNKTVFVFRN